MLPIICPWINCDGIVISAVFPEYNFCAFQFNSQLLSDLSGLPNGFCWLAEHTIPHDNQFPLEAEWIIPFVLLQISGPFIGAVNLLSNWWNWFLKCRKVPECSISSLLRDCPGTKITGMYSFHQVIVVRWWIRRSTSFLIHAWV